MDPRFFRFKNGLERLRFRGASTLEGRDALSLLIRIRFAHIVLELLLIPLALYFGWMFAGDIPYSLATLGVLLVFNLMSLSFHRREEAATPFFLWVQNITDITAMTILFGLAGGLTNPLHSLIHFQIGLAGILLPTGAALAVLGAGCVALAVLGWSAAGLANLYLWIGPLGPNLAYEWLLAGVVSGFALFAARVNRVHLARLREARERVHQQDRLRAVGATAAGFCHELATPLNASVLLGDRLRRKTAAGSPELDADWEDLRRNLERCERIVRGMAAAPWDADALSVQRTDVGLLVRKITAEWRGKIPVACRLAGETILAQAPAVGFGHVLLNLLRNAEEASPENAVIDLSLEADAENLRVRVGDRGTGLDPAVRRSLGRPFNSSKGDGRGLGLFAALHLVESLNGSLTFLPRAGGGTEAVLTLPRLNDAEPSP